MIKKTFINSTAVQNDEVDSRRQRLLAEVDLPINQTLPSDHIEIKEQEVTSSSTIRKSTTSTTNIYLPLSYHFDDDSQISAYEEVRDMILSAILVYGVVDLRMLARKQLQRQKENDERSQQNNNNTKTFLAEQLLSLPIAAKEVVRLVCKYRDEIVQEIGRESTVDLYLNAFDSIQSSSSSRELELELNKATFQVSLVSFDVFVVDDENADHELVYCISVDTSRRRITVAFRGCSSRKDWIISSQTLLKEIDNPLYNMEGKNSPPRRSRPNTTGSNRCQPATIAIHLGIHNYLFTTKDGSESKYDTIIRHLRSLLQQYPGYQVYVTGHSLGAALATVFAFQAAASGQLLLNDDPYSEIPTITCINFASPMIGNFEFEMAYKELEAQGRIRCLRVTNYFDIFTQIPDRGNWLYLLACTPWIGIHLMAYFGFSLIFFLCFQTSVYRHVGMDLHMYRGHKSWICCLPFRKRRRKKPRMNSDLSSVTDNNESNIRYWYKIKHSRGTSETFIFRVAHDYKKHMKQIVQRILSLPFVLNFDVNHSAQEHLRRIKGLEAELRGVTLKELYEKRTSPRSPDGSSSALCIV